MPKKIITEDKILKIIEEVLYASVSEYEYEYEIDMKLFVNRIMDAFHDIECKGCMEIIHLQRKLWKK